MSPKPFLVLGEQIKQLINAYIAAQELAKAHNRPKEKAMQIISERTGYVESTIYKWGQGRIKPSEETVRVLADIGCKDAKLDRVWGLDFLNAARYPNAENLMNELWGYQKIKQIPHNLPRIEHAMFVGRQKESQRLLELLSPNHAAPLISIDGIGGVGKSTLALEVAYKCLRASTGETALPSIPKFDAIVFVSAKQEFLTAYGILPRHQTHRALRDIYQEISHTLDRPEIMRTAPEAQLGRVHRALAKQRTLLIVDNLETMLNQQEVVSFLYDLPASVKAIITTRERAIFAPIRLSQLPEDEGLILINHQAQAKMVTLDRGQARQIYKATGGIPAAIIYSIGQLASGYSVSWILQQLKAHDGDIAQFCFEKSIGPMREQPAYHLLMAIAMFPQYPAREAVIHVAGLSKEPIKVEEGFAQLQKSSLINIQNGRCQILPLTREYGLAELATCVEFEAKARERWLHWCLELISRAGGNDWNDWYIKYDQLENEWTNLLAVFDWCEHHDSYPNLKVFWGDEGVCGFANIYGYWNDRIYWLTWLLKKAERYGDWPTYAQSARDLAFSLLLQGDNKSLELAKKHLDNAWNLRETLLPKLRAYLAENFAVLFVMREKDSEEGLKWLQIAESEFPWDDSSEIEKKRFKIHLIYYYGMICFEAEKFTEAKLHFLEMIELAQAIKWHRAINYAQNYLVDIAIEEGDYEGAEALLKSSFIIAERNKDRRRIAFFKRSYAILKFKLNEMESTHYWAEQAWDDFDRLGMQPEASQMKILLNQVAEIRR